MDDNFNRAVPQITKNYREFVEHIINIGGETFDIKKGIKLVLVIVCGNALLSIAILIILLCMI